MKAVVDRIEDRGIVVLTVEKGGEMYLPKRHFRFPVREGMWFEVTLKPDIKARSAALERIKKLQKAALEKY